MKPNPIFYFLFASLAVASLACSLTVPGFTSLKTGATKTFDLNAPSPGTEAVQDVNLSMLAGEFTLSGGADAMLEGQVQYNVEEWQPFITSSENSLTVSQGNLEASALELPIGEVINDWDVKLGNYPMNLTLHAGAFEADLDLSGLPIHRLEVQDGASDSNIYFNTLNPDVMEQLEYQTGASDINFLGLANANFEDMRLNGGAGNYTLDFSGSLQRDADVTIDVGLSDLRILVPAGVAARVVLDKALVDVNPEGAWTQNGDIFTNPGSGSQLNITIKMGAGTLELVNN